MSNKSIQFYQLLSSPLQVALPSVVRKAYDAGYRICITATTEAQESLSSALWEQSGAIFLPNGLATDENASHQPILFAQTPTISNDSKVLIITNMLECDDATPEYERILFMFNGNIESELLQARMLWKKYQQANYQLTYLKQNEQGAWQKI
jgi:DNA polymerase IIIc chi subunit